MGPALKYTVLRLVLFAVVLAAVYGLGAGPLLAVVLAALVSALLSYLLLRRQRDELSAVIAQRVERRAARVGGGPSTAGARRRAEDTALEDEAAQAALNEAALNRERSAEDQADAQQ